MPYQIQNYNGGLLLLLEVQLVVAAQVIAKNRRKHVAVMRCRGSTWQQLFSMKELRKERNEPFVPF